MILRQACPPDVQKLLAVTLSMIILNKFRNQEIRAKLKMSTKGQTEAAIRMLFKTSSAQGLLHVDAMMKFVGLKRSSLKYRLKLLQRYERANEHDDMLSMQLLLDSCC